jgi:DNA-binding MarR family transcriptional regulator
MASGRLGVVQDDVDGLAERWRAAGLSPQVIAQLELSKRIARIGGVLEQALKGELADLGLTYAEFDVLAALRRSGSLKPGELSRSLFLTSGGTSNVLQRLIAAGYVEREADPDDARSRRVRLSDKGATAADQAMAVSARLHEEILGRVPEGSVRQAADALREVLAGLGTRRFR